jgi:hypothetical protein
VKRMAGGIIEGFGGPKRRALSAQPVAMCPACDTPLPIYRGTRGVATVGVRERRRWIQVHVGCEPRLGLELTLSL